MMASFAILPTEWMVAQLTQCILLTAGLLLCLYLFITLKREIHSREKLGALDVQAQQGALTNLRTSVRELQKKLEESEKRVARQVPPAPSRPSINLSSRSRVLRMYRLGESQEHIAAVLGLPQSEVELMLKVHRLVVGSY